MLTVQQILGKTVKRSSVLDKKLQWELKSLAEPDDPYPTVIGKTVCTSDFYEGINYKSYKILLIFNFYHIRYTTAVSVSGCKGLIIVIALFVYLERNISRRPQEPSV